MHGCRRVIVFCLLTTIFPTILIFLPLYLRNVKYADVLYRISDSDVIQIHKGQSKVFCEKHSLKMNSSFNAFQMRGRPELSEKKKHTRLRKSMTLPVNTLEYWGFYLFKGATVQLKACSRYEGSKILVVKGEKILDTCGILNKKNKPALVENQNIAVTLENPFEKESNNTVAINGTKDNSFISVNYNIKNEIRNNTVKDSSKNLKEVDLMLMNKIQHMDKTKKLIKRDIKKASIHYPNTVLDTGVNHGGNAFNNTANIHKDTIVSSFENNLHECYQNNLIMTNYFPHSMLCNSTIYLDNTTTLKITHNVLEDGYYYYIFYSHNDIVMNDIYAIFDIYKPTLQYLNMSESKICINKTECEFDVELLSDELVIVEVLTKDGLMNNHNSTLLVSICHPRKYIYVIFPISVLLLILLFAFL